MERTWAGPRRGWRRAVDVKRLADVMHAVHDSRRRSSGPSAQDSSSRSAESRASAASPLSRGHAQSGHLRQMCRALRLLFWVLMYALLVTVFASELIVSGLRYLRQEYVSYSYVIETENIELPGITICHGNRYKKEVVVKFLDENTTWNQWLGGESRSLEIDDVISAEFYSRAFYTWDDMVAACSVGGKPCLQVQNEIHDKTTYVYGMCVTYTTTETVRPIHVSHQVLIALQEQDLQDGDRHNGWFIFLHRAKTNFSDALVFSGHTHLVRVWPSSNVETYVQREQLEYDTHCSHHEDAMEEYLSCTGDHAFTEMNISTGCLHDDVGSELCDYVSVERSAMQHDMEFAEQSYQTSKKLSSCPKPCLWVDFKLLEKLKLQLHEQPLPQLVPEQLRERPGNLAVLRLRFSEEMLDVKERLSYSFDAFLADLGGYMGLLLGGSLLAGAKLTERVCATMFASRSRRGRRGRGRRKVSPVQQTVNKSSGRRISVELY